MTSYYKNKYKSRQKYRRYSSIRKTTTKNIEPIVHTDEIGSRWQKLLKYYGSCISIENAGEVTLFSSKEGIDFLQVPCDYGEEWIISGKEKLELGGQNGKIQSFINGPKWSLMSLSYFYGFPCHVKYIKKSRGGWSGQVIQPILIFGIDLIQSETGYTFILQSDRPRINSAFLTDKNLLTSIEERKHIAEAILESWDEEKGRSKNFKAVLNTFSKLLPQEIPFSKDILEGKIIELNTKGQIENGILPIATIFRNTQSPYTYGLEHEIRELRDTSTPNKIWQTIFNYKFK